MIDGVVDADDLNETIVACESRARSARIVGAFAPCFAKGLEILVMLAILSDQNAKRSTRFQMGTRSRGVQSQVEEKGKAEERRKKRVDVRSKKWRSPKINVQTHWSLSISNQLRR